MHLSQTTLPHVPIAKNKIIGNKMMVVCVVLVLAVLVAWVHAQTATMTSITALSATRSSVATIAITAPGIQKVLFAGGMVSATQTVSNVVDIYDVNPVPALTYTRTTSTLTQARAQAAAATLGTKGNDPIFVCVYSL